MLLRRLVLEDFGLYRGVQEMDLVPRCNHGRRLPIVLVGGKNGAGKSTVLEAVLLGLYGKRAIGERVRDRDTWSICSIVCIDPIPGGPVRERR